MSPENLREHEKCEQDLQDWRSPHANWIRDLPTYEMRNERHMGRAAEVESKGDTSGQQLSRFRAEVLVVEIERADIHARPPNVPPLSSGRIRKPRGIKWQREGGGDGDDEVRPSASTAC